MLKCESFIGKNKVLLNIMDGHIKHICGNGVGKKGGHELFLVAYTGCFQPILLFKALFAPIFALLGSFMFLCPVYWAIKLDAWFHTHTRTFEYDTNQI